ncbi:hypothetical protein SNEBB_004383 [Seison nebaliae]|nr:hypothetical protein SNEBB_004383 [Seison nebaliae]
MSRRDAEARRAQALDQLLNTKKSERSEIDALKEKEDDVDDDMYDYISEDEFDPEQHVEWKEALKEDFEDEINSSKQNNKSLKNDRKRKREEKKLKKLKQAKTFSSSLFVQNCCEEIERDEEDEEEEEKEEKSNQLDIRDFGEKKNSNVSIMDKLTNIYEKQMEKKRQQKMEMKQKLMSPGDTDEILADLLANKNEYIKEEEEEEEEESKKEEEEEDDDFDFLNDNTQMNVIENEKKEKKYESIQEKNIKIEINEEEDDDFDFADGEELYDDKKKKIFIFEIYEENSKLYLIGKLNRTNESCCIVVNGMYREVLFENDGNRNFDMMKQEIIDHNQLDDMIMKWRIVERRDVMKNGRNNSYLQLYFKSDRLLRRLKELNWKETIHYLHRSMVEEFILQFNMYGPSWIEIENFEEKLSPNTFISWTNHEYVINLEDGQFSMRNHMKLLNNYQLVPQFKLASIHLGELDENIVSLSIVYHSNWKIDQENDEKSERNNLTFITNRMLPNEELPKNFSEMLRECEKSRGIKINLCRSESDLLRCFLDFLNEKDIDIIVGYDLLENQMKLLSKRLKLHFSNRVQWSKIGRIKRTDINSVLFPLNDVISIGRLQLDIKSSSKELIQKLTSFDFSSIVKSTLSINFQLMNVDRLKNRNVFPICMSQIRKCLLQIQVSNQLLICPLMYEITKIVGNRFCRTLIGGRAERNESLLLHEFFQRDFVLPSPISKYSNKKPVIVDNEATYTGGLVLEPKIGLYRQMVILIDFNSLYPSIIREFDICFSTINWSDWKNEEWNELLNEKNRLNYEKPVLPKLMENLIEKRKEVKELMKNEEGGKKNQLDVKQKALKLTANSIYGCLGMMTSRFYAKPLAALITCKGRQILLKTKNFLEKEMKIEVIYGDTDSLMINSNTRSIDEVRKLSEKLIECVNEQYQILQMGIDGIYERLLLLKKKKYAALLYDENGKNEIELKGIDVVRRDWCVIARQIGKEVIRFILTSTSPEETNENIINYLKEQKKKVEDDEVNINQFVISKILHRHPEKYVEKKSLPHVNAALYHNEYFHLNRINCERFKGNDTVNYVVCSNEENSSKNYPERSYTLQQFEHQFKSKKKLIIDKIYYISQQIFPIISRIVTSIDSIDLEEISSIFNISIPHHQSKLQNKSYVGNSVSNNLNNLLNGKKSRKIFDRFSINCPECQTENSSTRLMVRRRSDIDPQLIFLFTKCVNGDCGNNFLSTNGKFIVIQFRKFLQEQFEKLIQMNFRCNDITCNQLTYGECSWLKDNKKLRCSICKIGYLEIDYTKTDFHAHLTKLKEIFSLEKLVDFINSSISEMNMSKENFNKLQKDVVDAMQLYNSLSKNVKEQIPIMNKLNGVEWNGNKLEFGERYVNFLEILNKQIDNYLKCIQFENLNLGALIHTIYGDNRLMNAQQLSMYL